MLKEPQDRKVLKDLQETKGLKEDREILEHKEPMVLKEPMGLQVHKAQQDLKVLPDHKGHRVQQVTQEHRVI